MFSVGMSGGQISHICRQWLSYVNRRVCFECYLCQVTKVCIDGSRASSAVTTTRHYHRCLSVERPPDLGAVWIHVMLQMKPKHSPRNRPTHCVHHGRLASHALWCASTIRYDTIRYDRLVCAKADRSQHNLPQGTRHVGPGFRSLSCSFSPSFLVTTTRYWHYHNQR